MIFFKISIFLLISSITLEEALILASPIIHKSLLTPYILISISGKIKELTSTS
jgi:hypothetical protein